MKRIVVGIVGPIASGKGVASEVFQNKGFKHYSLSNRIREELRERGLPEDDRLHQQNVGDELREKFGSGVLAQMTIEKIRDDKERKIVIESIRSPGEINVLRESLGAFILGVDATQENRFKYLKGRGREGDATTWKEFLKFDTRETSGKRGDHQIQVDQCLKMADLVIRNDGSKDELVTEVEKAMTSLGIEKI